MRPKELAGLNWGDKIRNIHGDRLGEFKVLHVHKYEEGDAVVFCSRHDTVQVDIYKDIHEPSLNDPEEDRRYLGKYAGQGIRVEFWADEDSISTLADCEIVSTVNADDWEVVERRVV